MRISAIALVLALLGVSCTGNTAKSHFLLAERLWGDGNYVAAVAEFDKVTAKDPKGKLGQQARYRSAMTNAYFLSEYAEAIRKFKAFAEQEPSSAEAWEAKKQIGEILFSKTDQYSTAIAHYQEMLSENPTAPEAPEILFRIAKSQFFLWQFDDALSGYRSLIKKFPGSPFAEKAMYEIGVTQFTRGEQHPGGRGPGIETYQYAMDSFEKFLEKYPKSPLAAEARFGIASCLEELDQLDAAYHAYSALRAHYPSPKVIEIKLARIRERKAQRNR